MNIYLKVSFEFRKTNANFISSKRKIFTNICKHLRYFFYIKFREIQRHWRFTESLWEVYKLSTGLTLLFFLWEHLTCYFVEKIHENWTMTHWKNNNVFSIRTPFSNDILFFISGLTYFSWTSDRIITIHVVSWKINLIFLWNDLIQSMSESILKKYSYLEKNI